jgi:hypothetical protein
MPGQQSMRCGGMHTKFLSHPLVFFVPLLGVGYGSHLTFPVQVCMCSLRDARVISVCVADDAPVSFNQWDQPLGVEPKREIRETLKGWHGMTAKVFKQKNSIEV